MLSLIATLYVPLAIFLTSVTVYLMGFNRTTKYLMTAVYFCVFGWSVFAFILAWRGVKISSFHSELLLDPLSAIFIFATSLIMLVSLLYSYDYMKEYVRIHRIPERNLRTYYSLLTLTMFTLYMVAVSNNSFLMWAFVEATTMITVLLVCFGKYEQTLEAAWKYLVLCVVGLGSALYGTALIYSYIFNVTGDPYRGLLFTYLASDIRVLAPTVAALGIITILIGYGVKAGLVPMHWWLPDAYSEAPSPVSAVLSSVVTGCGFFAIFRWALALTPAIHEMVKPFLLAVGMASIFLGGLSIVRQVDLKRMLAYSSVENMGIIALGICFPPLGLAVAIMHLFNHSLIKASAFLAVGNLEYRYGRRGELHGVISDLPVLGALLLMSVLALEGTPPFSMFFSVLGTAMVIDKGWILALYAIGLLVSFVALITRFMEVSWGRRMGKEIVINEKCPSIMIWAPILLLATTLVLGLYVGPLMDLCWRCVGVG